MIIQRSRQVGSAIVIALRRICVRQDAKNARRKHGGKRHKGMVHASVNSRSRRTVLYQTRCGSVTCRRNGKHSVPPDSRSSCCGDGPRSARNSLLACLALPDADGLALHGVLGRRGCGQHQTILTRTSAHLAAEGAGVAGVLCDLHLWAIR